MQTGGPSGGCIPADTLDTPVDYESLAQLGSIMGSGGMIVMDETTDMVDVARFFMEFCMDESCGKCIPCRAGTVQMHRLLTRIVDGPGRRRTTCDRLEALCDMVKHTSLCGLGQTAPNPVLSTLRYFRARVRGAAAAGRTADGDGASPLPLVHAGLTEGAIAWPSMTLTIDGKLVSARPRTDDPRGGRARPASTSRRSATSTGCRDVGACRLCLVEVGRQPASCCRPASRRSPRGWRSGPTPTRLREYRRMIVELLFAERNHVCSVCVANGHCELQDLAVAVGVDHVRFDYLYPQLRGGRQRTSGSASTTTAASSARAACASATRSRARTPGTSPAAAPTRGSSPT